MYLVLKTLHIAAMVAWIGGMLVLGLAFRFLSTASNKRSVDDGRFIAMVVRWDRYVTTAAMLLVWGLGIAMAMQGGWFTSRWLMVKLVLVAGVSALHGVQSGRLRRLTWDAGRPVPAVLRASGAVTLVLVTLVAGLVVLKPF